MFGGGFGSRISGKGSSKKSNILVARGFSGVTDKKSKREIYGTAKEKLGRGEISVRWNAPLVDGSGYAEAARNYIAALSSVGVAVSAKSVSFEGARSDYGRAGQFANEAMAREVSYAINISFLTPDHFRLFHDPRRYNIGMFDWETDALPIEWVSECNLMDEVWVPAHWTAGVAKKSGVVKPVHVFGHCASPDDYKAALPLIFPELPKNLYKFYSIFQWTERKNPKGLLQAYLTEFTDKDPVVLIVKTYRSDYSESEQNAVLAEIKKVKADVGGASTPKVMVILDMLTKSEMLGLHRMADCFVLIQRAEGWGLPHFEACMMGKPVITTNYSANLEFTRPEHSYLVGYNMISVRGMDWIHWYRPNMVWADPSVAECRERMRHVFNNRSEAKRLGEAAQAFVHRNFTWTAVGERMKARLTEIARTF